MVKEAQASPPPGGQFLVYQTEDGKLKIDVRFEGETVWLTQQHMADLFLTTKQNIGQHLKSIFEEGELARESVVKNFFTTAADGKNYSTNFYNLDILTHAGRISHEMAQAKAESEYDRFKAPTAADARPVDADFDKAVKQLPRPAPKPRKKKQP